MNKNKPLEHCMHLELKKKVMIGERHRGFKSLLLLLELRI